MISASSSQIHSSIDCWLLINGFDDQWITSILDPFLEIHWLMDDIWLLLMIHFLRLFIDDPLSHRIHGAGILMLTLGVYWWDPWHTIYSSTVRIRHGICVCLLGAGLVLVSPKKGYTEIFTPDYLTSNEKFHIMRTEGYLSEKTRAIFLEFTIYNFNLGL
jgi:hypothetical protein